MLLKECASSGSGQKSCTSAPNITVESVEEEGDCSEQGNTIDKPAAAQDGVVGKADPAKQQSENKDLVNVQEDDSSNQVVADKEGMNFDGYSTPQTIRSKISHKRAVKNFNKSEMKISKQLHRSQSMNTHGHLPESRSTIPRFGTSTERLSQQMQQQP